MSLTCFPTSLGFVSHVDIKKWPCRPVNFKGQGSWNQNLQSEMGTTIGCARLKEEVPPVLGFPGLPGSNTDQFLC